MSIELRNEIEALKQRVAELEAQVAYLLSVRGPGRPRKQVNAETH